MRTSFVSLLAASGLSLALAALPALAAEPTPGLTSTEQRWLAGARPVLQFARQAGLPLDIVVQPQAAPGLPPLAMAHIDGRCKLVLSMRGNPEAEATLARIEPDLVDAAIELMTAHELGHCERRRSGAWFGVPPQAATPPPPPSTLPGALHDSWHEMKAVRREEGFADLVGLAWVRQRHPALLLRLQAWLVAERARDLQAGAHHDTLAFIQAWRRHAAASAQALFESAQAVWIQALAEEDTP